MGQVREIQDDWSGGCKQDQGIEAVPANAAWKIENMLPGVGGFNLGLRGGCTYASCSFGAVSPIYGGWMSPYLFALTDTGAARRVDTTAGGVAVTTLQSLPGTPQQNGVEFDGKMFFTLSGSEPKYFTGSTSVYTSVSASAPQGKRAAVYKGRLVLANDGTNKSRVWFSGVYDTSSTTAWQTGATGRWIDTSYEVNALASLQNMMLVFSDGHVERVRGTTPGGGGQAGDIVLEPLFDTGVTRSRNVTVAEDKCYFVNQQGVYMTDGANLVDLAEQAGMSLAWQASPIVAGGVAYASGWLFITPGWMINVQRRSWYALSFNDAGMAQNGALSVQAGSDEAYTFKDGTTGSVSARILALTPMLTQGSTHDPDGSAIIGTLQSRAFLPSMRQKRFRRFFARYEVTDPSTADPAVTVGPNYDPVIAPGSSLSVTSGITLPETTDTDTGRGAMNMRARSVAFSIATSGKGYPVGIQQIGVEAHELEPTRL